MNVVHLLGRIGKDAETKIINGTTLTIFSVATDSGYMADGAWIENVQWHTVKAWKLHERKSVKLVKGALVQVTGRIDYTKKDDKNYTAIIADRIQIYGNSSKPEPEINTQQTPDNSGDLPF